MKITIALKALFIAALALSFGAFAAPPEVTGSIDLVDPRDIHFSDTVQFDVVVEGKRKHRSAIIVRLSCWTAGFANFQSGQIEPSDWIFVIDTQPFEDFPTECTAELIYRVYSAKYYYGRADWILDTAVFPLTL